MFDPNHSRETAMLKQLMVTTAITGLMIGAAVAEGTPPSPAPSSPPAAAQPAPPAKSPDMSTPAPSSSASTATPSSSSAKFVNSQRSDQFLASKFKGTDVIGADDQKIGDVSDILFDKDGKIEAYVISVGGFLGIGSKDVAMAPSAFQVVAGDKSKNESDKLKVAMTKDELKQAANFEPYRAPSSTTGMGGPAGTTRPAPAGGGMAR
jgi:sporulation protein YlmC with PRC-barrel domain